MDESIGRSLAEAGRNFGPSTTDLTLSQEWVEVPINLNEEEPIIRILDDDKVQYFPVEHDFTLLDYTDSHNEVDNQKDLKDKEEENLQIVKKQIYENMSNLDKEMPNENTYREEHILKTKERLELPDENAKTNEECEKSPDLPKDNLENKIEQRLEVLNNQKSLESPKENENKQSQECLFRINNINIVVDIPDDITMNEFKHENTTQNQFYKDKSLVELSRYSWGAKKQFYLNGCKWSPDGTCVLTSVNEDGIHLIELPRDLYTTTDVTTERPLDVLQSAVYVKNGGTVYDYCWYPFMNSNVPETCCFMTTQQHQPIQMWDAFNGALRCSYRGYDAVDEVEAAISARFTTDASHVVSGYRKSIKIFKTDVPGRDFINYPIQAPASCLAVDRSRSDLLAIGSWNCSTSIVDLRSPTLDVLHKVFTHTGGVTHIELLSDENCLLTGARKDHKLLCWDLRQMSEPIFWMNRTVDTNQIVYFDISSCGRWLISGSTDGIVYVWDLKRPKVDGKLSELKFQLHHDCCNGVSFHPFFPIIASSSGQYHFENEEIGKLKENSLILWWYGGK